MILLALFIAAPSIAAVITFDKVTTYTDGTTIPTAKQSLIVYKAFYGPTQTGPWTEGASSTGLVIVAPDPAAGSTGWFTVSATLEGQESANCVPASKTVAPLTPSAPPGCLVR
jgi:hypothetical protein